MKDFVESWLIILATFFSGCLYYGLFLPVVMGVKVVTLVLLGAFVFYLSYLQAGSHGPEKGGKLILKSFVFWVNYALIVGWLAPIAVPVMLVVRLRSWNR